MRRYAEGRESGLKELPIQYADYAVWQREWLKGEVLEEQIGYWRETAGGSAEVLELPTDRPRPAMPSQRGGAVGVSVSSGELTERIRELSRAGGGDVVHDVAGGVSDVVEPVQRAEGYSGGNGGREPERGWRWKG